MTPDDALEVIADEVTRAALQEMIDNGLFDMYIDAELAENSSNALRACLMKRAAVRPDPATLLEALRLHVRLGTG